MYYVYILLSQKDKMLYIGYTRNLRTRFNRHKLGLVKATKNRLPLKLIYYEAFLEKFDAKRREKFLKGGKGHVELKVQLERCFSKVGYKYA